jgi:cytoskeletal protein CcmA (bactofilin family)
MAKNTSSSKMSPEAVISIIGVGMTIEGDSETAGSIRIEGTVHGSVKAGKSVVVGRGGLVDGSIYTQDAVISGQVSGGIHAVSRLELLATSEVSGEIEAPRIQVEDGAKVQGQITVGDATGGGASQVGQSATAGGGGKTDPKPDSKASQAAQSEPESKDLEKVAPEPEEPEGAQPERSGD